MTDGLPHHLDEPIAHAADAAVLQLAGETSLQGIAEPIRHPSAALFDCVVFDVAVVVKNYVALKNVHVTDKECDCLAEIAIQRFSRKILRDILECRPYAIEHLRVSVDFVLDVVGCADMMRTIHAANGGKPVDQGLLFAKADECVRGMNIPSANPRINMRVWPDLDNIVGDLVRLHRDDLDYVATDRVRLPAHAKTRCSVTMQRKSMAALLRAATPNREGWFDG